MGAEAYLITHYFQLKEVLILIVFTRVSTECALHSDLDEVYYTSKAILCILLRQHMSEAAQILLEHFHLFLTEVNSLALQWVRLPERAFQFVSMFEHQAKQFPKLKLCLQHIIGSCSIKNIAVVSFVCFSENAKIFVALLLYVFYIW